MFRNEFPILEYDGVSDNIIEPSHLIDKIEMPEQVVMCFYTEVIEKLLNERKLNTTT